MHLRSLVLVFAIVALSTVAFSQPICGLPGNTGVCSTENPGVLLDAFQINYLANPTVSTVPGGNIVNISNAGELGSCRYCQFGEFVGGFTAQENC